MFKVDVQSDTNKARIFTQVVCADTLYEAELLALSLVSRHNPDKQIMLVHRGNLIYEIYEIINPIGRVRIKVM